MLFVVVDKSGVPRQVDVSKRRIQQARFYAAKFTHDHARKMFYKGNRPAAHVTGAQCRQLQKQKYALARDIERGLLDHHYYVWARMNRYLTGASTGINLELSYLVA